MEDSATSESTKRVNTWPDCLPLRSQQDDIGRYYNAPPVSTYPTGISIRSLPDGCKCFSIPKAMESEIGLCLQVIDMSYQWSTCWSIEVQT